MPVNDRLAKTRFTDFCRLKKIDGNIDIKQSGPPHNPMFTASIDINVDEHVFNCVAFHKKKKEAELLVCLEFENQLKAAGLSYVEGNKYLQNPTKKVKEDNKQSTMNLYSRLIQQAKDAIVGYCNLHKIKEPPIEYSTEGPSHDLTHICKLTLPNYNHLNDNFEPMSKEIIISNKLKKKATQYTYIKAAVELSLMNDELVKGEPEIWNNIYPDKRIQVKSENEKEVENNNNNNELHLTQPPVNIPQIQSQNNPSQKSTAPHQIPQISHQNPLLPSKIPEIQQQIVIPQISTEITPQQPPQMHQVDQSKKTQPTCRYDSHPELDPRIALYNSINQTTNPTTTTATNTTSTAIATNETVNNVSEKRKIEDVYKNSNNDNDDNIKKQRIDENVVDGNSSNKNIDNEYTDVKPVMPIMDVEINNNIEPPPGVIINIKHPTSIEDRLMEEEETKSEENQPNRLNFRVDNPDKITAEQVLSILQMIANFTPNYKIESSGPDHQQVYKCISTIPGYVLGLTNNIESIGNGYRKHEAERNSLINCYYKIKKLNPNLIQNFVNIFISHNIRKIFTLAIPQPLIIRILSLQNSHPEIENEESPSNNNNLLKKLFKSNFPNETEDQRKERRNQNSKNNPIDENIKTHRNSLPIFSKMDEIIKSVDSNQITMIYGKPGSGKSTQVPQYIFDNFISQNKGGECNICVVQPSQLSVKLTAKRVAYERNETVGNRVYYQTKVGSIDPNDNGSIVYITPIIFIKRLLFNNNLDEFSHIIIDNVDNRDIYSDFILYLMKVLLKKRSDLKLVLMSSLPEMTLFQEYFNFYNPIIEIEMRQNDVRIIYSENNKQESNENEHNNNYNYYKSYELINYENITKIIEKHCEEGRTNVKVLIFLPDVNTIMSCKRELNNKYISDENVDYLFNSQSEDKMKIIISDDIAESLISINNVDIVIDSCLTKREVFDKDKKILKTTIEYTDKSKLYKRICQLHNSEACICYRLLSNQKFDELPEISPSAITCSLIEDICLYILVFDLGNPIYVMKKMIENTAEEIVLYSLDRLCSIKAISRNDQLVYNILPLGYNLILLPLTPSIGKVLFLSLIFHCLSTTMIVVGILTVGDVFIYEEKILREIRDKKFDFCKENYSDIISSVYAYKGWKANKSVSEKDEIEFCSKNHLNVDILRNIEIFINDLEELFTEFGYKKSIQSSSYSSLEIEIESEYLLSQSLLCASFYANIVQHIAKDIFQSNNEKHLVISKYSCLKHKIFNQKQNTYYLYSICEENKHKNIYQLSFIKPMAMAIFGYDFKQYDSFYKLCLLDEWILFRCDELTFNLIKTIKSQIDLLLNDFINNKMDEEKTTFSNTLTDVLITLLNYV